MTQEPKTQHYSAVLCRCCRQPIPLPAIVVSMTHASRASDPKLEDDPASRVFTLRCRACDKEKPYRVGEVVQFEGVPRPRVTRARTKSGKPHQGEGFFRTANA